MAKWNLPEDREIASKVIESEARQREAGLIGYIFGNAKNQPGNIGGTAVVLFGTLFAAFLVFGADTPSLSKKDGLSIIGGFISLSLGFVFGQKTSGR